MAGLSVYQLTPGVRMSGVLDLPQLLLRVPSHNTSGAHRWWVIAGVVAIAAEDAAREADLTIVISQQHAPGRLGSVLSEV